MSVTAKRVDEEGGDVVASVVMEMNKRRHPKYEKILREVKAMPPHRRPSNVSEAWELGAEFETYKTQ